MRLVVPKIKQKILAIAVIGVGAVAMACAAVFGFERGFLRFNYPSLTRFPVRGIDVSHHQGEIDWTRVGGEGFEFAYIKATEGADYVDPLFRKNWRNAKAAQLKVGAYHFYTFCRGPREQAANFLAAVPEDNEALPPVIDLEFGGNCRRVPEKSTLMSDLRTFTTLIKQRDGRAPIYYVTQESYEYFLAGGQIIQDLWLRDIFLEPNADVWKFWQYANRGRVEGIVGPVDLDLFNGNRVEWAAYLARRGEPH